MFLSQISSIFAQVVAKPPALPDVSGEMLVDGILNLVFLTLAAVSSIVLVIQGIKYSLSAGDTTKVQSARNGIIYALVGVVVAVTAWSLFNFVIDRVLRPTSNIADDLTLTNLISDIIGLIIFIGGIIAVIMIMVGAIRMTLAGGNADAAKNARNTIIYALVGAVIMTLAGPIMVFVASRL